MTDLTVKNPGALSPADTLAAAYSQQAEIMKAMAAQLGAACDKIDKLERQVRRLMRLTPSQVTELNSAVRKRAEELCREYRLSERERAVNVMIRDGIRREFGGTVKECSADDFLIIKAFIAEWEDTAKLRKLRSGSVNGFC